MKDEKTLTMSKKILIVNFWLIIGLVVCMILSSIMQICIPDLGLVLSAGFAELGVHTAVYAWKSKAENKMKIATSVFNDMADKYGPDIAVQVFQTVVQD